MTLGFTTLTCGLPKLTASALFSYSVSLAEIDLKVLLPLALGVELF